MIASAAGALAAYELAINRDGVRDRIGAIAWRYLAMELCDAADRIESTGGAVEHQRQLRDAADDCALRGDKARRDAQRASGVAS